MRPFPQNQSGSLHLVLMRCALDNRATRSVKRAPYCNPPPSLPIAHCLFTRGFMEGGRGVPLLFPDNCLNWMKFYRDVVGRDSSRRVWPPIRWSKKLPSELIDYSSYSLLHSSHYNHEISDEIDWLVFNRLRRGQKKEGLWTCILWGCIISENSKWWRYKAEIQHSHVALKIPNQFSQMKFLLLSSASFTFSSYLNLSNIRNFV